MTASSSVQTGNQGMHCIPVQYMALHLKDFTHKFGLDCLASVEGIEAPPNRRIRLEMFAGDGLASVEGIEAPLNRQKRLECLLATLWRR